MATLTSCRILCMLSFSISVSNSFAAAANSSLPEPHLPHIPHDPGSPDNYSLSSRIIVSALGILLFIVFIIILLHIYAKWCWWRRASLQQRMLAELHGTGSLPLAPHDSAKPGGLDKEILTALPTFEYKPQMLRSTPDSLGAAAIAKAAECTVCLAEFRPGEACKLLPKCEHFFHTRCIDVWFLSNATCPLCRATPGVLTVDEEAARGEADDEQCQETQRGLWCKHSTGVADEEKGAQDDNVTLDAGISLQSQKWRRSFSDKFLGEENRDAGYRVQMPTRWERSASYSTIDSLRDAESLVELSRCSRVSSLVSARGACHGHHHPPLAEPKSLLRIFST